MPTEVDDDNTTTTPIETTVSFDPSYTRDNSIFAALLKESESSLYASLLPSCSYSLLKRRDYVSSIRHPYMITSWEWDEKKDEAPKHWLEVLLQEDL